MRDYLHGFEGLTVEVARHGAGAARQLRASEIAPPGLCPLFYHNLIPYMMTLEHGGWFRWVRRDKNSFLRRPLPSPLTDAPFKDSRVNSAFPNEVLVQCPNHRVSVVAGVGLAVYDGRRNIRLRMLRTLGECPAGHRVGDELSVRPDEAHLCAASFNALFPGLLHAARGGEDRYAARSPRDGATCTVQGVNASDRVVEACSAPEQYSVDAETLRGPCRYHKRPVDNLKTGPEGLCKDAHHALYPYALELLYDGIPPDADRGALTVNCPGVTNKVVFRIEKRGAMPRWLKAARDAAAKIFEVAFYPVDLMDGKVTYAVDRVDGSCPAGHRAGDVYGFNAGDKKELCPASFHAVYPYIFLKKRGAAFDWSAGDDAGKATDSAPCPDCMGAVYRF
ncbi:MAG: TIGR04076 family protein [Deltaproteobacteria bacterium]|nr:TIGR04076 family protein [Deltaproteobacteria bacterium]